MQVLAMRGAWIKALLCPSRPAGQCRQGLTAPTGTVKAFTAAQCKQAGAMQTEGGGGGGGVEGGGYLQDGDLKGLFQLVKRGGSQAAAAAPDEAQGWRVVRWPVLASTCQQHLHSPSFVGEHHF